ncbi:MAG TPA: rhodanese-like domain-containing protein [Saprospiraceae bacterium]|nr:rhodanese-like domain-containing protein [Saprospiraceae bacterium]
MNEITAPELREELKQNNSLHLIDVREPYEHEEFNIGGRNIPLGDLMNHEEELKALSKTGDLVLYCRSGNRSAVAQKLLASRFGIENTINLKGGVMSWEE